MILLFRNSSKLFSVDLKNLFDVSERTDLDLTLSKKIVTTRHISQIIDLEQGGKLRFLSTSSNFKFQTFDGHIKN